MARATDHTADHAVGLRELRHKTREVLARVREGETIDVTDYGRLVARIVPAAEPTRTSVLRKLIDEGLVRPAVRPGFRPRMRAAGAGDRLSEALEDLRREERW